MKRALAPVVFLVAVLLTLIAVGGDAQIFSIPTRMNFQGRLARPDGTPVADGTYRIKFTLWNDPQGAEPFQAFWTQTFPAVAVRNGVFTAQFTGLDSSLFRLQLYLEIQVGNDPPLTPRQALVPVAYAFRADTVSDGAIGLAKLAPGVLAFGNLSGQIVNSQIAAGTITADKFAPGLLNPLAWRIGGNSGVTSGFLGTTDANPLELRVNNRRAARYSYAENAANQYRSINVLGGSEINSIGSGVVGGTIGGGGRAFFSGSANPNVVSADFGTVAGGYGNAANGLAATVGGGIYGNASGQYATATGGSISMASGDYSVVSGGYGNRAAGNASAVGGGNQNVAGGGYSSIAGGNLNFAPGSYAAIAGGDSNTASAEDAVVSGGSANTASGSSATVSGGYNNTASAVHAAIGGGRDNAASGNGATVAGGSGNAASGSYATAAGGIYNAAAGFASFAAGYGAKANHNGAFVWSDTQSGSLASTGDNQFLIGAAGGVGINTNHPGGYALNVNGPVFATTNHDNGLTGNTSADYNAGLFGGAYSPQARGVIGQHLASGNYGYLGTAGVGVFGAAANAASTGGAFSNASGGYALYATGKAGGATAWFNASDARYKTHIAALPNALDAILGLRGVTFEWNRERWRPMNFPAGRQIGFIAQEVEKVLPELVTTDQNGYKSVAYANVVPVLVEAIKRQQGLIEAQGRRLDRLQQLQAENAELRTQLTTLAAAVRELKAATSAKKNARRFRMAAGSGRRD